MIPSNNSETVINNLDVLFVIDDTISMVAEDYDGKKPRLDGVKEDCKYIIDTLSGANFSIITFNNKAKVMIPYTKDANIVTESIDLIKPINQYYAEGSSLNTPLDMMIASVKASQEKNDRMQILFFISDGEITNDTSLTSFKSLANYVDDGAVLGYGTTTGGYMKVNHDLDNSDYLNDGYLMDSSNFKYEKAVSKIDEDNLKSIARDVHITYINMNNDNLNRKLNKIKNSIKNEMVKSDKKTYADTYYFLIIPLLLLLVIEFTNFKGRYSIWKKY